MDCQMVVIIIAGGVSNRSFNALIWTSCSDIYIFFFLIEKISVDSTPMFLS